MPTKELLKSAAGGLLFVLPLVILALFAGQVAQLLADHVLRPLADRFEIGSAELVGLAIVALGVVLLAWVALQRLNRWFREDLRGQRREEAHARAAAEGEPGGPRRASQLVLVHNEGRFALGFHVDTLENGLMVVQTPGARLAKDRGILYLPPDQVSPLAAASQANTIDPVPPERPVQIMRSSPPLADHRLLRG